MLTFVPQCTICTNFKWPFHLSRPLGKSAIFRNELLGLKVCCSWRMKFFSFECPVFYCVLTQYFHFQIFMWVQIENIYFRDRKFSIEIRDSYR